MKNSFGAVLRNLDGPVLITGHTGFKGTWLTRYFAHLGVEVVGYSLPLKGDELYAKAKLEGQIREKFSDIRDLESIKSFISATRPGAVIHLAAQPLVLDSYQDPIGTFETNVMGSANLLEATRQSHQTKGVLFITTDKVYRNSNSQVKFREDSCLLGSDPYSASKVGAENVAIAWRNLGSAKQKTIISVARSGNVIGGGDYSKNRLLADIVRAYQNRDILEIRNPESTRPWQHVLDPLHGYILALENSISREVSETFNFGPLESSLSVKQVLDQTQAVWPHIKYKVLENTELPYESKYLELDSQFARSTLGWVPRYSQEDAITSTLNWWVEVLENGVSYRTAIDNDVSNYISKLG